MSRLTLIAAAAVAATAFAAPADAQSRYRGYSSYGGQADVPGDFRCDAYWDRGRTDCDAGWRDQRSYRSSQWRRWTGYGYGYGNGHGYGWGRPAGAAYQGAYGRPDLVYPSGGYGHGGYGYGSGYAGGQRDPRRVDWCRASYRSYDPRSGYYRAYSGRLVYCG
jgi:hypothetical protein